MQIPPVRSPMVQIMTVVVEKAECRASMVTVDVMTLQEEAFIQLPVTRLRTVMYMEILTSAGTM